MVNKIVVIVILGVVILLTLCVSTVHVLVFFEFKDLEQTYAESIDHLEAGYTEYIENLTGRIEKLESERTDLRKQLGLPPSSSEILPKLPEPASLEQSTDVGALIVIDALFVIVLGGMSFITAATYSRLTRKRWLTEAERIRKEAYQKGFSDAPKRLIEGTDVLSNVVLWLSWYKKGKARVDDAAVVQKELLMHLISAYRLIPVGEIGEAVPFDPDRHRTRDRVFAGEEVFIVEPGWRIGGRLIKLPTVSRSSRNG
jgi:hypothetical protein